MPSAKQLLEELVSLKYDFAPDATARKLALLESLAAKRLPSAGAVGAFHELLCFLRAYPESPTVRAVADEIMRDFDRRPDLRRFRRALADTGIAGTQTRFRFFWLMAIRLVERWPEFISIDWPRFDHKNKLSDLLHLLLPFSETPSLDAFDLSAREWLRTLRGKDETDAAFLMRRFEALDVATPLREKLYEDLDIPITLAPGPTTPARGRELWPMSPIVISREPPPRGRPANFRKEILATRARVRAATPSEARGLIDLANECMVTRHRDLLIFLYADERDVSIIDCGDGLQFACMGAVPGRRLMLEAVYGFLTLKNGVPIGYVLCSAFFRSSEVAYNIFESFRGAGAAQVYARFLGAVHKLFRVDTFALDPYQLGHGNPEGQRSGAWWFYYKLGFRPHDASTKRLVREELAEMRNAPDYRSPPARLNRLAAEYMFLHLGKPRNDVLGHFDLGNVGLHINHYFAEHFGADRELGVATCAADVARLLSLRSLKSLSPGERIAWDRWAPLVLVLPGVERWTSAQRRELRDVIRAKGGVRESDYVRRFDRHRRLRAASARAYRRCRCSTARRRAGRTGCAPRDPARPA